MEAIPSLRTSLPRLFLALFVFGPGIMAGNMYLPSAQDDCIKQLTFTEYFSNTTSFMNNWDTTYASGGNGELQLYTPDQVSIRNGILYLTADQKPQSGRKYISGIIHTKNHFAQAFGYFEMRARLPQGRGLWPAFWLLPETDNYPNEIDVMEFLGTPPDTIYTSVHWKDQAGGTHHETLPYHASDFTGDFHVFAVDWKPESLTWYVDGIQIRKITYGIPSDSMFILANLAVGGNWPGNPDATTKFPAVMEIDYIRAYRWDCRPKFLKMIDVQTY